jgi:ATP-dependent Clp endopeptidase proteolytic subunit ClpP
MTIPTSPKAREELRDELNLRKLIASTETEELNLARKKAQNSAHRVYTFYGAVNALNISTCMAELAIWSREMPGKPLTVIFNSPGGFVDDGMALYDYLLHLRSIGHHITTIALGRAASMGGILLQAGDVRVVGPNAFVLIHEVAAGTSGKLSEMSESIAFWKRQEGKLLKILAHRSKMTVTQIKRKWHKTDWWLDADEAVELGFADAILSPEHLPSVQPESEVAPPASEE